MKKLLLPLVFAKILMLFTLAAEDASATFACPLTPRANRQIIILNNDFSPRYLVSNGTAGNAFWGPSSASIPSGNYDVTLVSFDHRPEHTSPSTQPKEIWYFKFKDLNGNIVARTNSISDLPADQSWRTEKVNTNFYIPPSVRYV